MKDCNKDKIMIDEKLVKQIETIIESAQRNEISSDWAFEEILNLIKPKKTKIFETDNLNWDFNSTNNSKPQYITILDLESI